MIRVLFVNPSLRPNARSRLPPVGLACILTAVCRAGIGFDLLDMDADRLGMEDFRRHLATHTYDVVCVGCIVTGFKTVREIATIAREHNGGCKIVAGNSVATSIPELLLRRTEVDIGVIGEGDQTIVELLKALDDGTDLRKIKGISFLENGSLVITEKRPPIENLDLIGFPSWEMFDLKKYSIGVSGKSLDDPENAANYPLNAARGCPYDCTFCYHVFKGYRYRRFSDEMVMKEILRARRDFGATFITFWDELTFATVASVRRMVTQLTILPFSIGWTCTTRADLFDSRDIALLERAREVGCRSFAFSIESASPEILQAMNKKIRIERMLGHCQTIHSAGIQPYTSIIFGYPQETPKTIQMTLELCEKCNIYPSAGFLLPLPGTAMWDYAVRHNYIKDPYEFLMGVGDRQDFQVNMTGMLDSELIGAVVDGLRGLAHKLGLEFENPLKTTVYQKPALRTGVALKQE